jgi:hypothetical protein
MMTKWTKRDIFHKALGEFLTENSQLENVMFGVILMRTRGEFYTLFGEYTSKTFGPKIGWFEEVCKRELFTSNQQARLDESCVLLRDLLPKRNFIIHGETYEIGRGDEEPQMYRVGLKRGDGEYMNKFVADFDSEHGFNLAKINATTEFCMSIREKIASVSTEVVNEAVAKNNPT